MRRSPQRLQLYSARIPAANGYTLLMAAASHAITPSLHKNLPYDAVKDFAPVTLVGSAPQLLVAHPGLAAASIHELIALAKARPRQINYASGGNAEAYRHAAAARTCAYIASAGLARPARAGCD